MSERIIIDFDDDSKGEKEKSGKLNSEDKKSKPIGQENERIEIDLSEEINTIEIENIEETYEDKILRKNIDCCYKGTSGLNNYYESSLNFPEGIEKGFSQSFRINLKDEFFNSVLFNNRYLILSSYTGHVYFTDRFTGYVEHKMHMQEQSFEKTGLVISNVVYLNSVRKIFKYAGTGEKKFDSEEIYNTDEDTFIWSNLNRRGNKILFTEYCKAEGIAELVIIDIKSPEEIFRYKISVRNSISDRICISGKNAFLLVDSRLFVFDIDKMTGEIFDINIPADENSFLFSSGNRLYITTISYELYYLDLPVRETAFKSTGIKNSYINSLGGFGDNIFTGTMEGWKLFKSTGLKIYEFEDEYENRIECISRNVMVISKNNKIVFSNLNRFQEAEGYVISSDRLNETEFIVSAIISENEIFILTRHGILESFTNDKLNIHI
ncbi:MAG: hypothetical protein WAT71_10885 [Ignavibacteria bacterium]